MDPAVLGGTNTGFYGVEGLEAKTLYDFISGTVIPSAVDEIVPKVWDGKNPSTGNVPPYILSSVDFPSTRPSDSNSSSSVMSAETPPFNLPGTSAGVGSRPPTPQFTFTSPFHPDQVALPPTQSQFTSLPFQPAPVVEPAPVAPVETTVIHHVLPPNPEVTASGVNDFFNHMSSYLAAVGPPSLTYEYRGSAGGTQTHAAPVVEQNADWQAP